MFVLKILQLVLTCCDNFPMNLKFLSDLSFSEINLQEVILCGDLNIDIINT